MVLNEFKIYDEPELRLHSIYLDHFLGGSFSYFPEAPSHPSRTLLFLTISGKWVVVLFPKMIFDKFTD